MRVDTMQEVIAVVTDIEGARYELSLKVPSNRTDALDHGDVRDRLNHLLAREADRAATVLLVASKDVVVEREAARARAEAGEPKKGAKVPPAQVAFAGTDESIEVDKDGNEIARTKAGKRTLTKGGKG